MITIKYMKKHIQEPNQEPDWSRLHMLVSTACEEAEKEALERRKESSFIKKRPRADQEAINIPRKRKRSSRKRRRFQSPNQENSSDHYNDTEALISVEKEGVQNPDQENTSHNDAVFGGKRRCCSGGGRDDDPEERVLVFVRTLTHTDMSTHHGKLSLIKRTKLVEFLTDEEEHRLLSDKVPAKLIGPSGVVFDVWLRNTLLGKTSFCYTIGKPWNDIVKNNALRAGNVAEIRAWRRNGTDLWLSLDIRRLCEN